MKKKVMKKKVLIELRYANDNAFCRSYVCDENDIPKVGDKIFLLVSYGTVVSLKKVAGNKVADDYYRCEYDKYDYYLGKVAEGLPNDEWVLDTIKHQN